MKKNRFWIPGTIVVLFIALIAIQHYSPKPVNWKESYNLFSTTPYGCYILNDLLEVVFPAQEIGYNTETFYTSLDSTKTQTENFIVITTNFKPDTYDCKALVRFVEAGNQLFISAEQIDPFFLSSFKVKLKYSLKDSSLTKESANPDFGMRLQPVSDSSFFDQRKLFQRWCISAYDTTCTKELGYNLNGRLNFIGVSRGKGKVYIHTQPLVFTNYHLLRGNTEYVSRVLSHLPVQRTSWSQYYIPDRMVNTSPMRYILSQAPLRAAYYLLLLTLLLYLVVESKRKQRIIPVIKAPENRSLKLVKTVGSLYFNQNDNAGLARKKLIFFKEFLREKYHITTISKEPESLAFISAKTGVAVKQVAQLMEMVHYYSNANQVSDLGLIELNKKIEQFYNQCL